MSDTEINSSTRCEQGKPQFIDRSSSPFQYHYSFFESFITLIKHPSLLLLAVSFLIGVCTLQIQADLNGLLWNAGLTWGLLLVSVGLFLLLRGWRVPLSFIFGFLWALLFAQSYLSQSLPAALIGQNLLIEGVVKGLPDYTNRSVRFDFEVSQYLSVNGKSMDKTSVLLPSRLRLSWYYHKNRISSGELWRLKVRLKPPHGMMNAGGFDYEKWLYQKGIHATGYIRKAADNLQLDKAGDSIDGIRESLLSVISNLPDKTFQGLLQALTIGHKTAISTQQWQVLQHTGTSHLMAISGLHIGLVAGMVFFMVRFLVPPFISRYISAPQVAAIISIVAGGFYALLAGFNVPTQRAFIMLLVFMLAIVIKRPAFSINTFAWAIIAVLLINPLSVLSAGFWLSFSAVLIISLVSSSRLKSHSGSLSAWVSGLKIQWYIALGMLPLSVILFQQGSFISPIANMLAIPLVGMLIVPLALLASFLNVISTEMSQWLFVQTSELLSSIWLLLAWLADMPLAGWQRSSVPVLMSVLSIVGVALLLLPKGVPMRYSGVFLLFPMVLYQMPKPEAGAFWVNVVDVGQGLSVLVRTHDKALLYDTGAKFSDRFDIGQRVVVPYLNFIGVKQLDTLLLSHGDNDHAGGADAVMQTLHVRSLLAETRVLEKKSRYNTHDKVCAVGQNWNWNGVSFEVLHPDKFYPKSNNRSCVLKISTPYSSMLIAGDIERKAERQLLKRSSEKITADVVLVPHHGSNTSSSKAWLKKVNPQLAIVSAGYKNRFNHPTKKILKRYHSQGIEVLNTANAGMIQLKFASTTKKRAFSVQQQRKVDKHYWNHRLR